MCVRWIWWHWVRILYFSIISNWTINHWVQKFKLLKSLYPKHRSLIVMPFLVIIPHLLLIFYPVQECDAKIEPLSRIKSDELCHSQDEMTKLRGVNIDILCPGDLVQCMCHVRSMNNNELIRLTRPDSNYFNWWLIIHIL